MGLREDEDLVIDDENEVLDENNTEEVVEEVIENTETSEQTKNEDPETIQDEDEEDRIVTIGDSPTEDAESGEDGEDKPETPGWVKKVRKVNRKLESENKRLKRELENKSTETVKPVELGEKPTLASSKYDDAKYEQDLLSYYERKRKVETQATEKAEAVKKQSEAWQNRQELYSNKKQEHSFKDFGEVEDLVKNTLSVTQQGIIVQCADDSALVVYALGKNPKKLEEFSKITAPLDFATKMGKLESQLKVSTKKAPKPETRINGGKTGASGSSDKVLARLMAAADKSGDYTDVAAHNKKIRNKDS